MAQTSAFWLSCINRGRKYSIESEAGSLIPILPWIHPPLHPTLLELVCRLGVPHQVEKEEELLRLDQSIAHLAVVNRGVTGRNFGNNIIATDKAAAISLPGNIAYGNLNFFTDRPAFGHYFSITKAEVTVCPKNLLLTVLKEDSDLLLKFIRHLECCTLSDRLGLAMTAFVQVEVRLKAFIFGWAVRYGETYREGGKLHLRMPVPLTRSNQCLLTYSSQVSTDNVLKNWKNDGHWVREGDMVSIEVSFLDDAYTWMRNSEENSPYRYPKSASELFEALPTLRF